MTAQIKPPLSSSQAVAIAKIILDHPQYGLKASVTDPEDRQLITACSELLDRVDRTDRDDWTELKKQSMRRVSSPPADCVSRIASGMRSPDVYLSALRDAAEKAIEIALEAQHRCISSAFQLEIQSILDD